MLLTSSYSAARSSSSSTSSRTISSTSSKRKPISSPSIYLLLIYILAALLVGPADALWFFPKKRFQYQGLIDAGDLGLDGNQGGGASGGIVAWGDWDGDQFLDAFTISSDQKRLEVRLWDHVNFKFSSTPLFTITPSSGNPIVNVAPADYNHDGRLDVLVMTQSTAFSRSPIDMELWLGKGRSDGGIDAKPIRLPSASGAQPMLADGTGDMKIDLLGRSASTSEGETLEMWQNVFGSRNSTEGFTLTSAPMGRSKESPCELATPHSSAFIDLNGDCLADLFLVCPPSSGSSQQRYQIWTAKRAASVDANSNAGSSFTFARSGLLPPGAGQLSFADMNRDGTIDIVFPSCPPSEKECYINIVYNKQVGLCEKQLSAAGTSGTSSTMGWKDWLFGGRPDGGQGSNERCRRTEDLCVADDLFAFDFEKTASATSQVRIPFSSLLPGHRPLLEDRLTSSATALPVPLMIGDFNKDGYPDILLLSIPPKETSKGTGKTSVHILSNSHCSLLSDANAKAECAKGSSAEEEGRWLTVVEEGTEPLRAIDDVRGASWIDVDDDGTLDIMLLRGSIASRGERKVTFIQNNFFYDAFFLKSLCLNGACSSSTCHITEKTSSGQEVERSFKPWGASLPGASYKFTVLDPNGNRRAQQVGQQPQSSYRSLLTPYSYFGLGRTNNYVEKLFVGSTLCGGKGKSGLSGGEYFLAMEGLIPNSQLVISPLLSSPDNDSEGSKGETLTLSWHKELYLQPGDWIPWVTLTLVTLCLGLCGFVFAMHLAEKREDERERKKGVHAINFDALG